MEKMELILFLLQLVALVSCCLLVALLIRRSKIHEKQQQGVIEVVDPVVAHRLLIANADALSNRPTSLFPVALVTGPRRRRSDNITSVPYGPLWRALRCNLTAEILHPSRLGLLAPMQNKAIDALVADISASSSGSVVVVRDRLYTAMFALVARMCFGEGLDERQVVDLQRVIQEFVLAVGDAMVSAGSSSRLSRIMHWRRWRRFLAFRGRQAEVFLPLIAARRQASPKDDGIFRSYIDSLLHLRVPADNDDARREPTDEEMVSLVSEFLGASTESVVSCIEWTLAHLVAQPEVQNKLRREAVGDKGTTSLRVMPYLRAVVLESLRMHPPVPFLMRDVVQGTVSVRMHFMTGEIGRDKKTWVDPDEFRPERFLAGGEAEDVGPLPGPKEMMRMVPFGAGRRYCPGMGLGLMHVKLFLTTLVREFHWTAASPGVDMTELNGFFKVMKKPLRATVRRLP